MRIVAHPTRGSAAGGALHWQRRVRGRAPSAHSIAPPAASAVSSAGAASDALVARGCYRCLEHAYDAAASATDHVRTFETAVLLVARSKELGLPYAPWLERARGLEPAGPDWADYLAIVQALRIDPLADDRDVILVETIKNRASPKPSRAGARTSHRVRALRCCAHTSSSRSSASTSSTTAT